MGTNSTAAYLRCAAGQGAHYDYFRQALDATRSELFERLLLPLASDGRVSHIFGMALFSELQTPPSGDQP